MGSRKTWARKVALGGSHSKVGMVVAIIENDYMFSRYNVHARVGEGEAVRTVEKFVLTTPARPASLTNCKMC